MSHLHCPSCDHCADWHRVAQVQKMPFLPPSGPNLLQCAGCEPDRETGVQLCPAGEKPEAASETMRLMFIQTMRHTIAEIGL